jgi:GT2 family glycosyltransferase
MKYDLTASIVTFKNDRIVLGEAIQSFLNSSLHIRLYIIDNSPDNTLRDICNDPRCEYIFTGKNLGFGRAHNIAFRKTLPISKYHLVLNPDVYFESTILKNLYEFMENNPDVGQVMPKVLYPNGDTQYLCKLLPTPVDLFARRFFGKMQWVEKRNKVYELHASGYNKLMNVPCLSGCFMFLRTSALQEVGFFDEKFFMYNEDVDFTRRMHEKYKTVFYPDVSVFHHYEKGSYKNFRLMVYNIHGSIIYFTKWGWIFDRKRKTINKEFIETYLSKDAHQYIVEHESSLQ